MGKGNIRVVLVSPNERHILRNAGDRMPLGITHLSGALKERMIGHVAIDLNKVEPEVALGNIGTWRPELVCLTYLAPTSRQMKAFAGQVRLYSPESTIVAGGIEVTNNPGDSNADIEVEGFGESKLINLLTGSEEEFDIDRYRNNRRCFSNKDYLYLLEGLRATTMITSRGCPNRCVFCSVTQKRTLFRSMERLAEELDEIAEFYQAVHVYDDSFLVNRTRAMKVVDEFAKRGLKYRIEARSNHITPEVAKHLAETGCLKVAMGIESGSDEILKGICKGATTSQVEASVRVLAEEGIRTKGYFIIGLPGETEQTARQTIRFAQRLSKYGLTADFYPLCPFKGSPIAENPDAYGIRVLNSDSATYLNGGTELNVPTETIDLKADAIRRLIMGARK
jgi:radical SAM superfamily enzyme YgiQ (UPF0313 family)